jgi:hypothetical protein
LDPSDGKILLYDWPELLYRIGIFSAIPAAFIMVLGAVSMRRLQSRGLALAGAILAFVPFTGFTWLITMPIGIWALVVLNNSKVKAAFAPKEKWEKTTPQQQVKGRAVGLLIVGVIGCLTFGARQLCMTWMVNRTFSSTSPMWLLVQFLDLAGGLDLFKGLFLIAAVFPMLWMRAYRLAVAASIVAMLPVGPSFLPGLPIGIWTLVALSRTDVKAAFSSNAT